MRYVFPKLYNVTLKRIHALAILFILLSLPMSRSLASGSSYIPCDCHSNHCTCFIQEGDEGNFVKVIIKHLKEMKYLSKDAPKTLFSSEVTKAVKKLQADYNLKQTGTLDDDTLTILLWEKRPEELDMLYPFIPGNPLTYTGTVYIPTDGGKKRHATEFCSNMEDPRKVSIRNAEKAGFEACKKSNCEAEREARMIVSP